MYYRERLEEQEARKKKTNSAHDLKAVSVLNLMRGIRFGSPFSIILGLFSLFTSRKMRNT